MPDLITWSQVWISNWAAGVVAWLPLGYAFGAGMVSTVNPCGFAMLPAYLSLYVGTGEGERPVSPLTRLGRAYYVGLVVTAGFVVLFAAVGAVISLGGQFLVRFMPWLGLATGVALVVVGVLLLMGRHVTASFAARLAARVPTGGEEVGVRAFFLFGVGYAIASLSCTLPIFLVVVGAAIAAQGFLAGLVQFVSYALGMGVVLVLLTVGLALFKGAAVGPFRRALPYIEKVSAALVLLMGSYLVYYWLTKGGILETLT